MKDLIRIRQQIISPIILLNGNSLEELFDNGTCIINTLYGRYISPRTNSTKMDRLKMFIKIPEQCLNIDIGEHKNKLFYSSPIYRHDIIRFLENDPELRIRYDEARAKYMTLGSLKHKKQINLIYNIAAFRIIIKNLSLSNIYAINNIAKYGRYRNLYITKNSFDNKESYKNTFNYSEVYEVSIKDVNIKKMANLINKLNRLNYFKNE
jgi:hypothetical protein